jgi:hypothetical protein
LDLGLVDNRLFGRAVDAFHEVVDARLPPDAPLPVVLPYNFWAVPENVSNLFERRATA